MNIGTRFLAAVAALGVGCALAGTAVAQSNAKTSATAPPHSIGAAKLIIGDVAATQAFYEKVFGMKELRRFSDPVAYEEPIMGFESGGSRLALYSPRSTPALKKSRYPVALIYTPEFDALTKRIEDAKLPLLRLPPGQFRIAITRDPSGNAIEIMARDGKPEVGGSKLIVDDRQKAEDFYVQVFKVKPTERYKSATYDEVLMGFGDGAFLALFQPLDEAPLPKSPAPVVAIYTTDFDGVKQRIEARGLGFRELKSNALNTRIIIAQDPAGNAVEVISR